MFLKTPIRRSSLLAVLAALLSSVAAQPALAQGFISPSVGYTFSGDSGCSSATDCEDKNWNPSVSFGALGRIVGFEAEWSYESDFKGERTTESTSVMSLMGNFMLAPRISIVQPYGLVGLGLLKTEVEDKVGNSSESDNQFGWTIGGGVLVFLSRHVGLKGDVRHYHSFEVTDILNIDVEREDNNKLDFGRVSFGILFAF